MALGPCNADEVSEMNLLGKVVVWSVQLAVLIAVLTMGSSIHAQPPACCPGDCDGDGRVTIPDIIKLVRIDLEGISASVCACVPDCGPVLGVQCSPVLQAVNSAMAGCPESSETIGSE